MRRTSSKYRGERWRFGSAVAPPKGARREPEWATKGGLSGQSGLTLIEIAVVMVLVAIILSVAVPAFESASGADLRSAAMKISAVERACFGEAGVKNTTLRVAYDIDHGGFWVEAYPGVYQIQGQEKDLDRWKDEQEKKDEDQKRKDEEEKRKKELESKLSESSVADDQAAAPVPKFIPVTLDFVEPDVLPRGVKFKSVRTPQFRQEIKSGKAYTHFFPNGWAEHTLVYLQDVHGNEMTLETDPLSGKVVIWDGELDFKQIEDKRSRGEEGS